MKYRKQHFIRHLERPGSPRWRCRCLLSLNRTQSPEGDVILSVILSGAKRMKLGVDEPSLDPIPQTPRYATEFAGPLGRGRWRRRRRMSRTRPRQIWVQGNYKRFFIKSYFPSGYAYFHTKLYFAVIGFYSSTTAWSPFPAREG